MHHLQYFSEKEALTYCREQGLAIGKRMIRKWKSVEPGLFVVLPASQRGRYVRAVLTRILSNLNQKPHE